MTSSLDVLYLKYTYFLPRTCKLHVRLLFSFFYLITLSILNEGYTVNKSDVLRYKFKGTCAYSCLRTAHLKGLLTVIGYIRFSIASRSINRHGKHWGFRMMINNLSNSYRRKQLLSVLKYRLRRGL